VGGFFEGVRSFLLRLWEGEGMLIDPHGGGTTGTAPNPGVTGDEGISLDPHG
jgi:hypothetical protein